MFHIPYPFLFFFFLIKVLIDLECTIFSDVNLRFLILFYSEGYGLNKQMYFCVAIGWAFHALPLVHFY